jgi:hypothetical protein
MRIFDQPYFMGVVVLDNVEQLRHLKITLPQLTPEQRNEDNLVLTKGQITVGDSGDGKYYFDPDSDAADDNFYVIKPNSNPDTGRWKRLEYDYESVWQQPVESRYNPTTGLPANPVIKKRYISTATANGWVINRIYECTEVDPSIIYYEITPIEGFATWVKDEDVWYKFDGSVWSTFSFIPTAHKIDGPLHTASGLTTGNVLRATGATTFGFGPIQETDLPYSYVKLQASTPGTQQTGNFNVSGVGIVGKLGINCTPSAWHSSLTVMELYGLIGNVSLTNLLDCWRLVKGATQTGADPDTGWVFNSSSSVAHKVHLRAGSLYFAYGGTGTVGTAVTWIDNFTFDANIATYTARGLEPYVKLINTVSEDVPGGRESRIYGMGFNSEGTGHTLGYHEFSYQGEGNPDYTSQWRLYVSNSTNAQIPILTAFTLGTTGLILIPGMAGAGGFVKNAANGLLSGNNNVVNGDLGNLGTAGKLAKFAAIGLADSVITEASSNLQIPTTSQFQFRDTALYISSKNDGYLDFDADTAFRFNTGKLGINCTPDSTWNVSVNSILEFYGSSSASSISNYANHLDLAVNAIQTGATEWKYKASSFASVYKQTAGGHDFYTAISGTAGNVISFYNILSANYTGITVNLNKISGYFSVNGQTTSDLLKVNYNTGSEYIYYNAPAPYFYMTNTIVSDAEDKRESRIYGKGYFANGTPCTLGYHEFSCASNGEPNYFSKWKLNLSDASGVDTNTLLCYAVAALGYVKIPGMAGAGGFVKNDAAGLLSGNNVITTNSGVCFHIFDTSDIVLISDGITGFVIPVEFNGYYLTGVIARVFVKGVGGMTSVQVRKNRSSVDINMLSSTCNITTDYFSINGVVDLSNKYVQTGDLLFIDVKSVHSILPPYGLSVTIGLARD